jgi:hypothetical protein
VRKRVEPGGSARPGAKATPRYISVIGVNQAFVFDDVRIPQDLVDGSHRFSE